MLPHIVILHSMASALQLRTVICFPIMCFFIVWSDYLQCSCTAWQRVMLLDVEMREASEGKADDMKCELANLLIASLVGGACTHMFLHHVILQNLISSHQLQILDMQWFCHVHVPEWFPKCASISCFQVVSQWVREVIKKGKSLVRLTESAPPLS